MAHEREGARITMPYFLAAPWIVLETDATAKILEKNARMLVRTNTTNEELENIAMIAAYMDYLVNLEENVSAQLPDARPISRWREFGLQKGVLRI